MTSRRGEEGLSVSLLDLLCCGMGGAILLLILFLSQIGKAKDASSGLLLLTVEITLNEASPVELSLSAADEPLLRMNGVAGKPTDQTTAMLMINGAHHPWNGPSELLLPGDGTMTIGSAAGATTYRISALWMQPPTGFEIQVLIKRTQIDPAGVEHWDRDECEDGGKGDPAVFRCAKLTGSDHRQAFPSQVRVEVLATGSEQPSVCEFGIDDADPSSTLLDVRFETRSGLKSGSPPFRTSGLSATAGC